MYAQCPSCLTVFSLDADALGAADGLVRCGQCGSDFNALQTLAEALPEDGFDTLPTHPSSPLLPTLTLAVVHGDSAQSSLFARAPAEPAVDAAPQVDSVAATAPAFIRYRRPTRARHSGRWLVACLVLALVLGAQLVYAERISLTRNAATRPWLAQACAVLHCTLPAVRDTTQLQLLSRQVQVRPSAPGALLISATLRNNAAFRQPYPVVSITLSDLDGNRIAMRRFRPKLYITNARVRTHGMAPGATAALVFEVKNPGPDAVAFQFGFE